MRHRSVGRRAVRSHHRLHVLIFLLRGVHRFDQARVVDLRPVEVRASLLRHHQREGALRGLAAVRRPRQLHFDGGLGDHAGSHHEDDQQHQRDIHQGSDVDSVDPLFVVRLRGSHG